MGYLVLDTRWEKVEGHGAFEGICVLYIYIYICCAIELRYSFWLLELDLFATISFPSMW